MSLKTNNNWCKVLKVWQEVVWQVVYHDVTHCTWVMIMSTHIYLCLCLRLHLLLLFVFVHCILPLRWIHVFVKDAQYSERSISASTDDVLLQLYLCWRVRRWSLWDEHRRLSRPRVSEQCYLSWRHSSLLMYMSTWIHRYVKIYWQFFLFISEHVYYCTIRFFSRFVFLFCSLTVH